MYFHFALHRYWLNFKRHRNTVILAITILTAVVVLVGLVYPGSEAVEAYLGIPAFQLLFGEQEVDNPGMLVWLLFIFSSFLLTILYPVIGIFFGVKILPFSEKEGKELLFSTEKSPLKYFLENLLIATILIPLTIIPAYLIGVMFLVLNGSEISPFVIASIIPMFYVMVVMLVSSLGSAIKSSQRTGFAFGGVFFIVSFTLNLLQEEIDFVKDINLMSQINSFQHAIAGTWNQEFIIKCLLLIGVLIILTIFFLYRTDYIETRSRYVESTETEERRSVKSKVSFIRTPVESILSGVGWKFPAFRDQLQSSAGIFLIYLIATSLLLMVVALVYPGDETMTLLFSEMEATLNSPIIAAFMFNHSLSATLEGFVLVKIMLFHWIYYAPFLFIFTYDIIMRDRSAGYDEITWSMPRTRTLVLIQRTLASIVYLWLIILANWIALWIGEYVLSMYADVVLTDFGATNMAFIFLGIGYSFFLVLFVAVASLPHPKYLPLALAGTFLVALFLPVIWYMNQDFSWLLYLSPFYYFDVAGMLLSDINLFGKAIPEVIIYGVVTILFFTYVVRYWTPKQDIA